ncbi:MAG TPA: helix-turn-helix transcriptional regulator [Clostridia bacterium]|nr:helix-turn-helix transcriptional regulator [Clostridia bacterium]
MMPMESKKLIELNSFINKAYECFSFQEFLKLTIMKLHELVIYDSGMFFCAISKDSSFFKPYISGKIEDYYKKQKFDEREEYLKKAESLDAGSEAYVYKCQDYQQGIIHVENEPRSGFLTVQNDFYIVCMRIVYKGQFLGEIYLHRSKDKHDFDEDDLYIVRLMQPHVSTVFNIIHTITAVKYLEANNIPGNNTGICTFDSDMSLTGGNLTGVEMLKTVTVFGSSILYHLKEICADSAGERFTEKKTAFLISKILKTPNGDIRAEIFTKQEKRPNNKFQHVVIMQFCDDNQITADYKFKFTKREADIIDGLIQGKNNPQLAEALYVSENTIKTHIKSIYKKTGASNRTELTYVLMLNR